MTCNFELPPGAKHYVPHTMRKRADGSDVCSICHPGTPAPMHEKQPSKELNKDELDAYVARPPTSVWSEIA